MSQDSNSDDSNNINDNSNENNSLDALDISASELIDDQTLDSFYSREQMLSVMAATLNYIDEQVKGGLILP